MDVKESVAGFIEDFIGKDEEDSTKNRNSVLQDSPQTLHKRFASNGPEVVVSPVSGERKDQSNKENEFEDDFDESNLGVDEVNDQPQLMTPGIRQGRPVSSQMNMDRTLESQRQSEISNKYQQTQSIYGATPNKKSSPDAHSKGRVKGSFITQKQDDMDGLDEIDDYEDDFEGVEDLL